MGNGRRTTGRLAFAGRRGFRPCKNYLYTNNYARVHGKIHLADLADEVRAHCSHGRK